jgi:hypothetical protein
MEQHAHQINRIWDILVENRSEATPLNEYGLPGVFSSPRMSIGDLSLDFDSSHTPTPKDLSDLAWHFKRFAEQRGHNYEVCEGKTPALMKRLSTGDTLRAYVVRATEERKGIRVHLTGPLISEASILRDYLRSISKT